MLEYALIIALVPFQAELSAEGAAAIWGELAEAYCLGCHSGLSPKGDLNLDGLDPLAPGTDRSLLRTLADVIRTQRMPPQGKHSPTQAEREALAGALDELRRLHAPAPGPGRSGLRRLNRTEYQRTIRDLLGVEFDALERLPADDVGHGFDVIADVLTLPPLLLEHYVDAAEWIAPRAFLDPTGASAALVELRGDELTIEGGGRDARGAKHLYSQATVSGRTDVPRDGRYRVVVRAAGQQAGPAPVRLAIAAADHRPIAVDVTATIESPEEYGAEFTLAAGPTRLSASFINDYYQPDHPDPAQRDRNAAIWSIALHGPLDAPRFPAFQRELRERFPGAELDRREALRTLVERAWRRPADEADVDALIALAQELSGPGASAEAALRAVLPAILIDPRFLVRIEHDDPGGGVTVLDDWELATRLSFFLWSSIPDEDLRAAAAGGRLRTSEGRESEVRRMLKDPRAGAIAENFAAQWLQIGRLDSREPDPHRFPGVDRILLESMRAETVLFVDSVVREERLLWTLLDADYRFVNERLASHYGIEGVRGEWMRRVPIEDPRARGLLGHASVLTASSNPTRTSPVKRGKWVLEALLDEPPPPAPPGVPPLEQSASGENLSVRDQLARHRADPACAGCHTRMDALGFALERFDAVGRIREDALDGAVDDRGELPDGRIVAGPNDLRAVLMSDSRFLRALAAHMMVYALGRGLDERDEAAIDGIERALEPEPTFTRLVLEIIETEAFRMRAPPDGDS